MIFLLLICAVAVESFTHRLVDNRLRLDLLSSVFIFDNVVDLCVCENLDNEVKLGGLGHTVFTRDSQTLPRTAVEASIHSILTSLRDDSPIVEYWWRQEWMSLELHRDIDEKLAQQQGPTRYPDYAHVLYLSIGDDVLGPTVVLHDSNENKSSDNLDRFHQMTIIPAVNGRLLRFKGDMMHATPRYYLPYLIIPYHN